jgi:hypothetical protein
MAEAVPLRLADSLGCGLGIGVSIWSLSTYVVVDRLRGVTLSLVAADAASFGRGTNAERKKRKKSLRLNLPCSVYDPRLFSLVSRCLWSYGPESSVRVRVSETHSNLAPLCLKLVWTSLRRLLVKCTKQKRLAASQSGRLAACLSPLLAVLERNGSVNGPLVQSTRMKKAH